MKGADQIKIRIMRVTLIIGIVLMIIKFLAYFLTHSNAVLTDAIESVVNIAAGAFALFSLHYAARPKDPGHPYGHGKIEFLSAGIEGGMILLAGAAMLIKGVVAFLKKETVHDVDTGAILSALAGLVNWITGMYLIKKGKAMNSAVMKADGKHLITDTISSVGLVAGLVLIYFTHWMWIDQVTTLLFGCFIIYTGIKLVRESVFDLLDKADQQKLEELVALLNKNRNEKWIDVHNLRVLKYGAHLHVDGHLTLPWYLSLEESHEEVTRVENLVKSGSEQEIELFIHADPCIPASCSICGLQECEFRKQEQKVRLDWSLSNVLPDKKHGT